jgi:hypothetical protein
MVESNSALKGNTTIILTADHGGYGTQHTSNTTALNYNIPFIVWGKNVTPGASLYSLNTTSRLSPSSTVNPSYTGTQPIRNGDAGNLALDLLGLGPIPNSMINTNQDLRTQELPVGINGPLKKSTTNGRYFTDNSGRAIYLTGSHTWDILPNYKQLNTVGRFEHKYVNNEMIIDGYEGYLTFLKNNNHNLIRLWNGEGSTLAYWEGDGAYESQYVPWQYTGTKNAPKFDLTKFNQVYFDRLDYIVRRAQEEGVYVKVMLFEGWGLKGGPGSVAWNYNPFHKNNNINGINGDPNNDTYGLEVHSLAVPAITTIQKAYIAKTIDTLNKYDNVIYEISNEDNNGVDAYNWQVAMMDYVRSYQATKTNKHLVGMSCIYNSTGGNENSRLFGSTADFVTPCGAPDSGYNSTTNIAATNGSKVYFSDTDHIWGSNGGNATWVWQTFTRGHNPIFMDEYGTRAPSTYPSGFDRDGARRAMGNTLTYANKVDLKSMVPSTSACNTTYCLVKAGSEYIAFNSGTGVTTINSLPAGNYEYEWMNVTNGAITSKYTAAHAGGNFSPTSGKPSASHVLYVKNTGSIPPPLTTPTITSPINNTILPAGTTNVTVAWDGTAPYMYRVKDLTVASNNTATYQTLQMSDSYSQNSVNVSNLKAGSSYKFWVHSGTMSNYSPEAIIYFSVATSSVTNYTLTASSTNGSIAKSPNQTSYNAGTVVTLIATPNTGYKFSSWTGCNSTTNSCTLTMDGNKTVIANFVSSDTPGDLFGNYSFGYMFQGGVHQEYLGNIWTGGKGKGHIDRLFYNFKNDGYGGLPLGSCLERPEFIDDPVERAICDRADNMDLMWASNSKEDPAKNLLIKNITLQNAFRTKNSVGGTSTAGIPNDMTNGNQLPHTDTFQSYMGSIPGYDEYPEWLVIQDSLIKNADGGNMIMGDTHWAGVVYQNLETYCESQFVQDAQTRVNNDFKNFIGSTGYTTAHPCGNQIGLHTWRPNAPVWLINISSGISQIGINNPPPTTSDSSYTNVGPVVVIGTPQNVQSRVWDSTNNRWTSTYINHPKDVYFEYIEDALAAGYERPPYIELSCSGWRNPPEGCESKKGYLGENNSTSTTATLTTSVTGSGLITGTGIICGVGQTDCSETYPINTSVTLTATPAVNSTFTGWGGACSGTGSCVVSMSQSKNVTATFSQNQILVTPVITTPLNNTIFPTNTTSVTINWTGDASNYLVRYNTNGANEVNVNTYTSKSYTVPVTAGNSYSFWVHTGTLSNYSPEARINFIVEKQVSSTYTLTANKSGTGNGTITGNLLTYNEGDIAILTATPDTNSTFGGWSGCSAVSNNVCTVNMTGTTKTITVAATFTLKTQDPLPTSDKLVSITGPSTVEIGKTYDIVVKYDAKAERYLTFDFKIPSSTTYVSLKQLVPAGIGKTQTFQLTIPPETSTTLRLEYLSYLSTTGSWTTKTAYSLKAGIIAKSGSVVTKNYTLSTNATNGNIAKSVNGVATSSSTFTEGTAVVLTATPATGYKFGSWTGCTSTTNVCTVTMTGTATTITVTANFVSNNTLVTPTITSPANNTVLPAGTTSVTVSWTGTGPFLYRVKDETVSTNNKAKYQTFQMSDSYNQNSVVVSNLKAGSTYRFWVHTGTLSNYSPEAAIYFSVPVSNNNTNLIYGPSSLATFTGASSIEIQVDDSKITNALTVSAKVMRISSTSTYTGLVKDEDYTGNKGYYLGDLYGGTTNNSPICFRINGKSGDSAIACESSAVLSTSTFTHYVGVFDGVAKKVYLYRDGTLVSTKSTTFSSISTDSDIEEIGDNLKGQMKEVQIFNKVLNGSLQ